MAYHNNLYSTKGVALAIQLKGLQPFSDDYNIEDFLILTYIIKRPQYKNIR